MSKQITLATRPKGVCVIGTMPDPGAVKADSGPGVGYVLS